MTVLLDLVVPGGFGGAWQARQGNYITLVDLDGQQAVDFVAFSAADSTEAVSTAHTREALLSIFVRIGDRLVTNRRRPALEIVEDTVGIHDGTIPACDPTRYSVDFGVPGHRNCVENMWAALRPHRIDILAIPEPLNVFQNSPIVAEGRIGLADPTTRPGDRITFKALIDLFGAVSACPQDIIPANGLRPSPVRVVVSDKLRF
jgi:uncharacterized protein